jgi:hypothetical protein
MNKQDRVLHQVHWAKLGADGTASIVSLILLCNGYRSATLPGTCAPHGAVTVTARPGLKALCRGTTARHRPARPFSSLPALSVPTVLRFTTRCFAGDRLARRRREIRRAAGLRASPRPTGTGHRCGPPRPARLPRGPSFVPAGAGRALSQGSRTAAS